jgi:hypothetical protein
MEHFAIAAELDRLLPTSSESDIEISTTQDGQALDVTILNRSEYVVTSLEIYCFAHNALVLSQHNLECSNYQSNSGVTPGLTIGAKRKLTPYWSDTLPVNKCDYALRPSKVLDRKYNEKIKPNAKASIYAEIPSGMIELHCTVHDLRGRRKKWFE